MLLAAPAQIFSPPRVIGVAPKSTNLKAKKSFSVGCLTIDIDLPLAAVFVIVKL